MYIKGTADYCEFECDVEDVHDCFDCEVFKARKAKFEEQQAIQEFKDDLGVIGTVLSEPNKYYLGTLG